MTAARPRRLVVASAVGLGAAASVVLAAPAVAEPLGPGWEGSFVEPFGDGFVARGETLEVPVVFEYTGPPGSTITELSLELRPASGGCEPVAVEETLDDADDGTPPTTTPEGAVVVEWTFRLDPGCNGLYDVEVVATASLPSFVDPTGRGTSSGALVADDVEVSLAAPSPVGVTAEAAPDGLVTVRWQPPDAWRDEPPRDAGGYKVQRVGSDGAPITIAQDLAVGETSVVDDDLVGAPYGEYRYRVLALRADAGGDPQWSAAGEAAVQVGVPPTTTPPPSAITGSSNSGVRVGGVPRSGGVAAAPPLLPEVDTGFEQELDYDDMAEVGEEQAVPPADAGFFDIDEESSSVQQGLLVPIAVGLCLVVWAGHLRHLARRAAPPLH